MTQRKKKQDKGYKGAYERYKRYLENNAIEIMMHGDEIYLREDATGKMYYTHWTAKRGVLLYNWLAPHIDELRELAGEELPMPVAEASDPESFVGLLSLVEQQMKELSEDLDEENENREHPLNPLLRSWLTQIQVLTSLREKETR